MNGPDVPDLPERRDLGWLEGVALAPLVAAFVWLGVNPSVLTDAAARGAHAVPAAVTSYLVQEKRP
jgi:NADH:ubiquinone oxidoreductase subunit 4 (subunit M)